MPSQKFYRIAVTAAFLLSSAAVLSALAGDPGRCSGFYEEDGPVESLSVAFCLVGLGVCSASIIMLRALFYVLPQQAF